MELQELRRRLPTLSDVLGFIVKILDKTAQYVLNTSNALYAQVLWI